MIYKIILMFPLSFPQAFALFGHICFFLSLDTEESRGEHSTIDKEIDEKEKEKEKEQEKMVLNKEKSVKCYLTALKLDPLNEEAGWGVSEIYMGRGGNFNADRNIFFINY